MHIQIKTVWTGVHKMKAIEADGVHKMKAIVMVSA